ncbi:helix-hairpin-helix domain-containing protein [Brevibacillus daliensis]|uniref:helix-hairpin-helix domain-containing protein n=1 Tax=Brevibacillus daliensis TaxID=2892995 RepID=UPI001E5DB325|nr:helix-hairpin-helix domain-containing protein [Brevibacillus daliensis]
MLYDFWERYRKWLMIVGCVLFVIISLWLYPLSNASTSNDLLPISYSTEAEASSYSFAKSVTSGERTEEVSPDLKVQPFQQSQSKVEDSTKTGVSSAGINTKDSSTYYIDIKGSVKNPGMYQFQQNERVSHAIERAGGFLPSANTLQVNLAQKLTDGMILFVPDRKDQKTVNGQSMVITPTPATNSIPTISGQQPSPNGDTSSGPAPINIRTATKEEIMKLPGIGPTRAEEILVYREQHGFTKLEDLRKIPGIGPKTFEKIKKAAVYE